MFLKLDVLKYADEDCDEDSLLEEGNVKELLIVNGHECDLENNRGADERKLSDTAAATTTEEKTDGKDQCHQREEKVAISDNNRAE